MINTSFRPFLKFLLHGNSSFVDRSWCLQRFRATEPGSGTFRRNQHEFFQVKTRIAIGECTFATRRAKGFIYVDKTDLVFQLAADDGTPKFLSRPRRFGKSTIVFTLEKYGAQITFSGRLKKPKIV